MRVPQNHIEVQLLNFSVSNILVSFIFTAQSYDFTLLSLYISSSSLETDIIVVIFLNTVLKEIFVTFQDTGIKLYFHMDTFEL